MQSTETSLPTVFVREDSPLTFRDDEVTVIAPYNQDEPTFSNDDEATIVYERTESAAGSPDKVAAAPPEEQAPAAVAPAPRVRSQAKPSEPVSPRNGTSARIATPLLCFLGAAIGFLTWYVEQRPTTPDVTVAGPSSPSGTIASLPSATPDLPSATPEPPAAPLDTSPPMPAPVKPPVVDVNPLPSPSTPVPTPASATANPRKGPRRVPMNIAPAPKNRAALDPTSDLARAESALAAKLGQASGARDSR